MRASRLLTAILALLLVALVPAGSPSSASDGSRPGASRAAAGDEEPTITITSRVIKRSGKAGKGKGLFFIGKVRPRKGPIYIQRATRCNREKNTCNFKWYATRHLKDGGYQAKIAAPPTLRGWMWRAKVGTTYSDSWVTCTKTDKQVRKDKDCKIPF